MIESGLMGFVEATAFDSGYRRACADMLLFLESVDGLPVIRRVGMEMLRTAIVPESLEALASGESRMYRKTDEKGKAKYFVGKKKSAKTADLREKISQDDTELLETSRKGGKT